MRGLIKRNLLVYFTDKAEVFFSLLSTLILLMLYVLFLGENLRSSMVSEVGEVYAKEIVNLWILAGSVCLSTFTTAEAIIGFRIYDKESKVLKDFLSSPIKRWEISLGYILSSIIVAILLSSIIFGIGVIFLSTQGTILGLETIVKFELLIILSSIVNATLIFFVSTFMETRGGWSALSIVSGTLLGFITGMYVPLSILSPMIEKVATMFPTTILMGMFKETLITPTLVEGFNNNQEAISIFFKELAIGPIFGGEPISTLMALGILFGFIILFTILSTLRIKKYK